ncbi:MAG: HepT-like ribonuclease domain-containing protein, partial [Patescibacteria group bacterium]|nr:HepT-like ribonuclease domain-containing protein [Patescibacteria group bacterium]
RIQIIGEAVKSLPQNIKFKYPKVAWKEIAGMRDKLVHDYFEIDFKLTWEVVQRDLPVLKKQIARMKSDYIHLVKFKNM